VVIFLPLRLNSDMMTKKNNRTYCTAVKCGSTWLETTDYKNCQSIDKKCESQPDFRDRETMIVILSKTTKAKKSSKIKKLNNSAKYTDKALAWHKKC